MNTEYADKILMAVKEGVMTEHEMFLLLVENLTPIGAELFVDYHKIADVEVKEVAHPIDFTMEDVEALYNLLYFAGFEDQAETLDEMIEFQNWAPDLKDEDVKLIRKAATNVNWEYDKVH